MILWRRREKMTKSGERINKDKAYHNIYIYIYIYIYITKLQNIIEKCYITKLQTTYISLMIMFYDVIKYLEKPFITGRLFRYLFVVGL